METKRLTDETLVMWLDGWYNYCREDCVKEQCGTGGQEECEQAYTQLREMIEQSERVIRNRPEEYITRTDIAQRANKPTPSPDVDKNVEELKETELLEFIDAGTWQSLVGGSQIPGYFDRLEKIEKKKKALKSITVNHFKQGGGSWLR